MKHDELDNMGLGKLLWTGAKAVLSHPSLWKDFAICILPIKKVFKVEGVGHFVAANSGKVRQHLTKEDGQNPESYVIEYVTSEETKEEGGNYVCQHGHRHSVSLHTIMKLALEQYPDTEVIQISKFAIRGSFFRQMESARSGRMSSTEPTKSAPPQASPSSHKH